MFFLGIDSYESDDLNFDFGDIKIKLLPIETKSPQRLFTFLKQYGYEIFLKRLTYLYTSEIGKKNHVTPAFQSCPFQYKPLKYQSPDEAIANAEAVEYENSENLEFTIADSS